MSLETAIALIGFAFVMSVSPGPANFLLLASGANFGFGRSIPLMLGVSLGFLAMVVGVGLGMGQIFTQYPEVAMILRTVCMIYVVWLAWKIGRSRATGGGAERMDKPFTFIQAALLQLVNPKAWAVALIVTISYVDVSAPRKSLAILVGLFAVVNIPSISVWAISGSALRRYLAEGRRIAIFNLSMAILLVMSMIPVLLVPS